MAKNFKNTGVLRNIKSAANHRSVNATVSIAAKGIQNTAKWIATDHLETDQRSNIMALEQDLNFIIAKMVLMNRRTGRRNNNILEFVAGWVIDHMLFIFDLLWGFIWPFLLLIVWSILSAILVSGLICLTFYLLFQLLIS